MAEDESDDGQPELADVVPLPARTDDEPASPAELAAAMSPDSEQLREAMEADPATAAMRRAFGIDEQ